MLPGELPGGAAERELATILEIADSGRRLDALRDYKAHLLGYYRGLSQMQPRIGRMIAEAIAAVGGAAATIASTAHGMLLLQSGIIDAVIGFGGLGAGAYGIWSLSRSIQSYRRVIAMKRRARTNMHFAGELLTFTDAQLKLPPRQARPHPPRTS